ncbi:serine protease [Palleronia sp. KMU-117]|uniref:serine protease n=1 Tax=Palleronia sp. KMU-117 TaxID=3434108 RepID=UPI003D75A098
MKQAFLSAIFLVATFVSVTLPLRADAQEVRWVQIEARPNLEQALERVRAWDAQLENVSGFRLPSGWYAIALGPFTPEVAQAVRADLRARRAIPADSFVADPGQFRQQYWPEGAGFAAATPVISALPTPDPAPDAAPTPLPSVLQPQTETLAEARAAERALTREDREEIQRALAWDGFYGAAIDGAFGQGTRRAIEAWQAAQSYPVTGVLQTAQRNQLVQGFRDDVASLGLQTVRDPDAGIEITLPTALVARARAEAPFVHYDPATDDGVKVLLISLPGEATALTALYDIMQTLEIVPLAGPRGIEGRSFTLVGEDATVISQTYAEVRDGAVKGFTLIWPQGDEKRRLRTLAAMQASFAPLAGQVLPDDIAPLDDARRRDLLSGLEIRSPESATTGFYVDAAGRVLTAAESVAQCGRLTLGEEITAEVVAVDPVLGLALLRPQQALSPLRYAGFDAGLPRPGTEIAVSGFSFGGVLGAPTMTFGTLEDTRALDGREDLTRLALIAEDGDSGGPVFDTQGSVLGMLLPRARDTAQRLPDDVRYAADAEAIALFLDANGITPRPAQSTGAAPIAPEDLAVLAADMTVLVECWN